MVDSTNAGTMTPDEKLQYIEKNITWLSGALLGDLRTFQDGIELYLKNKTDPSYIEKRGGGNVALIIPLTTALELASALYTGQTQYKDGNAYNATENVKQFVERYFPGKGGQIPLLLWDAIRNGVDHLFVLKKTRRGNDLIEIKFFVDPPNAPSTVKKLDVGICVKINSLEFYDIVEQAINAYKNELQTNGNLQDKFIEAWESIKNYTREINEGDEERSKEIDTLLGEWRKSNSFELFK
jgi:hypothetical protein